MKDKEEAGWTGKGRGHARTKEELAQKQVLQGSVCPGIGGHLPENDQSFAGWVVRDASARSLEAGSEQVCSIWETRWSH